MDNQEGRHKLTVADVLLEVGCWVTRRDLRQKMGETVESWGVTGDQLAPLLRYTLAMAGSPQIGAGEIVNLCKDKERLLGALQDWSAREAKLARPAQLSPGEAIRIENLERQRRQEADWQRYQDDLAAGRVQRMPKLVMPWDRKGKNV